MAPLVVGLGNRWRGEDAVGPLVLDGLRDKGLPGIELVESPADTMSLINAWQYRDRTYVVDACYDHTLKVGTIITIDDALADNARLEQMQHPTSSHVLDLQQAIALSQSLGSAPQQLKVYAVVVDHLDPGIDISPAISDAVDTLVERLSASLSVRPQTEMQIHGQT